MSISALLSDGDAVWASSSTGLYRIEADLTVRDFRADAKRPGALIHPIIDSLLRDRDGRLWIGSKGGLQLRDQTGDGFSAVVPVLGAVSVQVNPEIHAMRQDARGRIWLATDQGLTRVRPEQREARFFGGRGLFERCFNFAAATRGSDGSLFFGGPG